MSKTDKTTTAATTTTVPDWDTLPCVQYGFPEGQGPARAPKLRTIFETVPTDATTASPVYLLSRNQYERQERLESGYEVKGVTSIATELQDECEATDEVLYPIHIESDVYHEENPATLIEWFRKFTEDYLDVPFDTCRLYFSGNRSIHVHVPRFVSGERQRKRLKELAETFCEDTGAELDCGLYYAKRLFRLPGVEHAKTGLRKVEIEPEWNKTRIFREANEASPDVPESYEAVLRRVFATQSSLTVDTPATTVDPPHDLFHVLDSNETVLEFGSGEKDIETPLVEQDKYPDDPAQVPKWAQYRAKEFSPYALASGSERSVAVVKVKGGAFACREVRNGATLVPVYFYAAQGCAGDEFTKADEHAPLQLSKRDYEKWDYQAGDHVVIIGGQSRNSRIFEVAPWDATVTGHALTGDEGSREDALHHLEEQGYEIGAAGRDTSTASVTANTAGTRKQRSESGVGDASKTEAAKLQSRAEDGDIMTLTHMERWRVACRLLKIKGWKPAWEWFRRQFGDGFDADLTRQQFRSVIESYPDDYEHVKVPSQS